MTKEENAMYLKVRSILKIDNKIINVVAKIKKLLAIKQMFDNTLPNMGYLLNETTPWVMSETFKCGVSSKCAIFVNTTDLRKEIVDICVTHVIEQFKFYDMSQMTDTSQMFDPRYWYEQLTFFKHHVVKNHLRTKFTKPLSE